MILREHYPREQEGAGPEKGSPVAASPFQDPQSDSAQENSIRGDLVQGGPRPGLSTLTLLLCLENFPANKSAECALTLSLPRASVPPVHLCVCYVLLLGQIWPLLEDVPMPQHQHPLWGRERTRLGRLAVETLPCLVGSPMLIYQGPIAVPCESLFHPVSSS